MRNLVLAALLTACVPGAGDYDHVAPEGSAALNTYIDPFGTYPPEWPDECIDRDCCSEIETECDRYTRWADTYGEDSVVPQPTLSNTNGLLGDNPLLDDYSQWVTWLGGATYSQARTYTCDRWEYVDAMCWEAGHYN